MSANRVVPWYAILFAVMIASETTRAQIDPPVVKGVRPLGLGAGETATLDIQGTNLQGASILFEDAAIRVETVEASGDRIKMKLHVPKDVAPGPHRFRMSSPKGVSSPGFVYVGRPLPLVAEAEPNNGFRRPQPVAVPAMIAGEVKGGEDVDVFAVDLKAGQTIVAEAIAARAGSGLDPLVTIFSPEGRELAADDDLFGRDAATSLTVTTSGRYFVQIQDANGRNPNGNLEPRTRRDYLLAIGEIPLVLSTFPAGGRRGTSVTMTLLGINLPENRDYRHIIAIDAPLGDSTFRLDAPRGVANAVTIRVNDLPEVLEAGADADDSPAHPQVVAVPAAIDGRFAARDDGDFDCFRLVPTPGNHGDYAITAYAARFGSAADPVLAVLDDKGKPCAEDDDKLGRDARIERVIGPEGITLSIREYFGRGGPRYGYRIEVERLARRRITVTADLGLRTIPRRGALAVPFTLERANYDGPTTVLAGPLPEGVRVAPVTIPGSSKGGLIVFQADTQAPVGAFPLRLVVRDVPASAEVVYREMGRRQGPPKEGPDGKPASESMVVETDHPILGVAEPAPIGLTIETGTLSIAPGQQADLRVRVDRRGDPAKKPLKLKVLAGDGGLEGFEPVPEASLKADENEHVFHLKAKPGAGLRRITLTVRATYAGENDAAGVDAPPAELIVP